MSEVEFKNYLTLLGGLLRLSAKQRDEISGELQDHFEERLGELLESGVSRDEAVRMTLAEFGDAAGLAAAFVHVSRNRRKRWIMKWTIGSIGGLAALAILTVALWPQGANVTLTPTAVAQAVAPPATPATPAPPKVETKSIEDNNARTEAALAKQVAADFVETPLADVIEFLSDLTTVEFYVNWKKLEEEGIMRDALVTINLKKVRVDMLLDLALAQAGESAAYVLRDGIVVVSSSSNLENATEVRVYNCRDLLKLAPPLEGGARLGGVGMSKPHPGGFFAVGSEPSDIDSPPEAGSAGPSAGLSSGGGVPKAPVGAPMPPPKASGGFGGATGAPGMMPGMAASGGGMGGLPGMTAGGGYAGGMGGIVGPGGYVPMDEASVRAERLMNIITTAVAPASWSDAGGFGTIAEYNGLLVVNHNAHTHRQIEKVLMMLREAIARDAASMKAPASGKH